ncbi:MAG: alpha/beta fold hydrolase [bacterium]|nr:alpha/beta fold hydrolase [bacterium]
MTTPTMDGIRDRTVVTPRLTTRVLFSGTEEATPVVFLHGNVSSATWWEETMVALPDGFRGVAPDMRGYGAAEPAAIIDATNGVGDWVDDTIVLFDHLGLETAHLVATSLGSVVAWRLLADHPARWLSLTQVSPGSPHGFGATRDVAGTPTTDDYAGSGAGLINPEFLRLIAERDTSADSPFSPRSAIRSLLVKPPFIAPREDALVDALLDTHLGDQAYPGDAVSSGNWPFVSPGDFGPNNAISPKYLPDPVDIAAVSPRPPVLWIRGSVDLTVSDNSAADPGTWGPMGLVPGYPGTDAYPSQPMVSQTRRILDDYAAAGGFYEELVLDCGHLPAIELPEEFNRALHAHLASNVH